MVYTRREVFEIMRSIGWYSVRTAAGVVPAREWVDGDARGRYTVEFNRATEVGTGPCGSWQFGNF